MGNPYVMEREKKNWKNLQSTIVCELNNKRKYRRFIGGFGTSKTVYIQ